MRLARCTARLGKVTQVHAVIQSHDSVTDLRVFRLQVTQIEFGDSKGGCRLANLLREFGRAGHSRGRYLWRAP